MLTYGERIQMIRAGKGMTQARLAQASGVPQGAISNIEKGKRDMTLSTLAQLCAALDVPPSQVFESIHPKPQRHWITRERIERLARAAWGDSESLNSKEQELVTLLKRVVLIGEKSRSQKSSARAWTRLRSEYESGEIKILVERVRGEGQRRHA